MTITESNSFNENWYGEKSDYLHDYKPYAIGALVGQAVGDALGAPYEFGPAGKLSAFLNSSKTSRHAGVGPMLGGGGFGWKPAEFTDDTQMALCIAESLLSNDLSYNPADIFERFVHWADTARDVGTTTASALFSGHNHFDAAAIGHAKRGYSGGNGSVMRVSPIGIWGVNVSAEQTFDTAFNQARLTHYDEKGALCAGLAAVMIRGAIVGEVITPEGMMEYAIETMMSSKTAQKFFDGKTERFAYSVLNDYSPAEPNAEFLEGSNGSAWVCLAQAFWALKESFEIQDISEKPQRFENAVVTAVDLGGDTDTVACVTGALAGALYGIQAIPSRFTTYLNGTVDSPFDKNGNRTNTRLTYNYSDLSDIARRLIGLRDVPRTPEEPVALPKVVDGIGVYASNLGGAKTVGSDVAVLSLCRTFGELDHVPVRREVYIIDNTLDNHELPSVVWDCVETIEAWLDEGRQVLVHCHAGRSRTGFVLKAWYMAHYGKTHAEAHEWLSSKWSLYDPTGNAQFTAFLDTF